MECRGKPEPLRDSDLIVPDQHWARSTKARVAWYTGILKPHEAPLREAAADASVPEQLVAATVLNEMTEIRKQDDVIPDQLAVMVVPASLMAFDVKTVSLGIAQIQIQTALDHKLLPLTPGDFARAPEIPVWAHRAALARKLTIRPCAILACARELRWLLRELIKHARKAWASQFGFSARAVSGDRIYDQIDGDSAQVREKNLAEMVIAAYNSPEIAFARQPGERLGDEGAVEPRSPYRGARYWAQNGRRVAADLYEAKLFRKKRA